MAIQFPTNPIDNQIFVSGSKTYIWIESKQYWRCRATIIQNFGDPNTLAAYGITDTYTKTEVNALVSSLTGLQDIGQIGSGIQGIQGITGSQGIQGITGEGTQGTTGTQGIQGITGSQGIQGITGAGTQGITGTQGTTGTQGITGAQGIQGITGAGTQGTQGIQGLSGSGGGGSITWLDYVLNWTIEPVFVSSISQGDVYHYYYNGSDAYRLIPTDGISVDSFYAIFSNSILSTLLAQRGNL